MRFHLLSDLHTEDAPFELSPVPADALVLAGDIGDPRSGEFAELLKRASECYVDVVLVAGNHECYGLTINEAHGAIERAVAPLKNVHFLNRRSVKIGDVTVVGTTLWSDIQDEQRRDVQTFLADLRCILGFGLDAYAQEHRRDVAYVREAARSVRGPVLVATHHSPLSEPGDLGSAFGTDLSAMMGGSIVAWCHGHNHKSRDIVVNGTRVVSNQRGYLDEKTGFDPKFTFDVCEARMYGCT